MPSTGTLTVEEVATSAGRVAVEEVATLAGTVAAEHIGTLAGILAVAACEVATLVAGRAEDWATDLVALLRGRGGWSSASLGTTAAFLWAVGLPLSNLSNIEPFQMNALNWKAGLLFPFSYLCFFFFFFFLGPEVDIFSLMYSLTFSLNSSKIEPI